MWITPKFGLKKAAWQVLDLWYNGLTLHNILCKSSQKVKI